MCGTQYLHIIQLFKYPVWFLWYPEEALCSGYHIHKKAVYFNCLFLQAKLVICLRGRCRISCGNAEWSPSKVGALLLLWKKNKGRYGHIYGSIYVHIMRERPAPLSGTQWITGHRDLWKIKSIVSSKFGQTMAPFPGCICRSLWKERGFVSIWNIWSRNEDFTWKILLQNWDTSLSFHICCSYGSLDYNTIKSKMMHVGRVVDKYAINYLFPPCK